MKKSLTIILSIALALPAIAQERRHNRPRPDEPPQEWRRNGFYISLGYAMNPNFSDFFGYINSAYDSSFNNTGDALEEFGSNICINFGYVSRFHRNFAIDAGIGVYSLKSRGTIINNNSSIPVVGVTHDLEYQVGVFSATLPILFDFSPRQPVVPYIGLGLSIFSIRLDDARDDGIVIEYLRDTKVMVGGHFEVGVDIRVTNKLWIDARGRWHDGSGKISTLESIPGRANRDFTAKQNVSQYSVGVIYYFR